MAKVSMDIGLARCTNPTATAMHKMTTTPTVQEDFGLEELATTGTEFVAVHQRNTQQEATRGR